MKHSHSLHNLLYSLLYISQTLKQLTHFSKATEENKLQIHTHLLAPAPGRNVASLFQQTVQKLLNFIHYSRPLLLKL
jgi:hypothetical protein